MSRNDMVAAAVGALLVLVLGAVAIAFATEEDDGRDGIPDRVAALEERVDELETRLGTGFNRPRFLDDLEVNEELLRQLFQRFSGEFPELGDDFQFDFDPSFLEGLVDEGLLDGNQAQELREALEMLRRAFEEATGG